MEAQLWIDKYRPNSLDKLTFHSELTPRLRALASSADLPHLLFVGPSGAGKRTRIQCLLRDLYGTCVDKLKVEHRTLKISVSESTTKTVEVTVVNSTAHLELTPADSAHQDRLVIMEVLKDAAQTALLPIQNSSNKPTPTFKVVVLHEVDRLSKDAQHALRRTMEKYTATCRIIMCASSTTKIIMPLRSRVLVIRVPAVRKDHVEQTLEEVMKKEYKSGFNPEDTENKRMISAIAGSSMGNMRRALLQLEVMTKKHQRNTPHVFTSLILITWKVHSKVTPSTLPARPDWEIYIHQIARESMQSQTANQVIRAREMMYELLAHAIPGDVILRKLTESLLQMLDQSVKVEVASAAAFYEHRMKIGQKEIFHLEAFLVKFMSIYKKFLVSMV